IDLGQEQLLIFTTTVLVTVYSDLLIGIASGILMKIFILLVHSVRATAWTGSFSDKLQTLASLFVALFKSPLHKAEELDQGIDIYFSGPLTCFNSLSVRRVLKDAIKPGKAVRIILTPAVSIVDHSSTVYLKQLSEETRRMGCCLSIEGLDNLHKCNQHADSFHYRLRL
ncbi:MAG: hypothetical protein AB1589_42915, partial [Cyanobacteriota bacterium]